MTKQAAINAMLNGAKVTHPNIIGYLFMDSGKVYESLGDVIYFDLWVGDWEKGWSIYREEAE